MSVELQMAAKAGNVPALAKLLQEGIQVDSCSRNGWTALILAAKAGHIQAVKFLLECGAKVNAKNATGQSAIAYANHGTLIALLLRYGATYDEPVIPNEWLQEQISIQWAEAEYGDWSEWQHFRTLMQPGEELWRWEKAPHEFMADRAGLAIVRQGQPVRILLTSIS